MFVYRKIFWLNILVILALLCTFFYSWINLSASDGVLYSDFAVLSLKVKKGYPLYQKLDYVVFYPSAQKTPLISHEQGHKKAFKSFSLNTPLMVVFLKWLVSLSTKVSFNSLIWTLFSMAGALLSVMLAMWYVDGNKVSYGYFPIAGLLLWMSFPGVMCQAIGQVSFFLLPLLMLALFLDSRKKGCSTAFVLGLLAAAKLFFLLFLFYFLFQKRWRDAGIFVVSFLVLSCLPLITISWDSYQNYFQLFLERHEIYSRASMLMNFSVTSLIALIINFTVPQHYLLVYSVSYYVSSLIIFGLFFLYYYCFLRHLKYHRADFLFAFITVMMLLLSPLGWLYYFVMLLLPVALLFKVSRKVQFSVGLLLLLFVILILPLSVSVPPFNKILYIARYLGGLLSLVLMLVLLHCVAKKVQVYHEAHIYKRTGIKAVLFMYMLVIAVLMSTGLLLPYYFKTDKTEYIANSPKGYLTLPANLVRMPNE